MKALDGLDANSQKITHVADATTSTDGPNYGQLLAVANGRDTKESARASSMVDVDISAPGASMDGVALSNGDRVLLLAQTDDTEEGPWVFNGAAAALTRPDDFPAGATGLVTQGATVVVVEGTLNAHSQWTLATPGPINVGTTSQTWTETTQGSAYTNGDGLALTGNTFSVEPDDNSIAVGPGGVSVNAGDGLQVTTDLNVKPDTGILVTASGVAVDPDVVVGKYSADIGDGVATTINVVHNLGTEDVTWSLRDTATGEFYGFGPKVIDANTVRFVFPSAPASASLRVVIHG